MQKKSKVAPPTRLPRCAALLLAAACSDESTLSTFKPDIETDPVGSTVITFDKVVLGRTEAAPQIIRVKNVGEANLVIDRPALEGTSAALFEVSSNPRILAPNQSGEIFLRFHPNAPIAEASALLHVTSSDPDERDLTFPLLGSAREPCLLAANLSRIEFEVGDVKPVTLTAISSHECVIERISTDSAVFPVVNAPALPSTIPAGASIELQIQHLPVPATQRGAPVRQLFIDESEGSRIEVKLEGEPPLFNCITFRPDQIIFPETPIGDTRQQRVTLENHCGKPATLTSVVIGSGWETYTVEGGPYPEALRAGATTELWVTYLPKSPLGDFGKLVINTNDAAAPRIRIPLTGKAAVPDIRIFPPTLDFGTVIFRNPSGPVARSECSSASKSVVIFNSGSAPLTISSLGLAPALDQQFEIAGVLVDGNAVDHTRPIRVPPSIRAEVTLVFYPTRSDPALHESRLLITHDDPSKRSPMEVILTGNATVDGPVEDTFVQLDGPKVDILWVIDDSCSMFDEQARLIQNLSGFVAHADAQGADYQMGVVVTDERSPDAGKLQFCYPHPRIITSAYPDRDAAFQCLFNVGVQGSYIEAGLGAAMRAIQLAQDPNPDRRRNPNVGFLRNDANLAIVALSDEEDQSLASLDLLKEFFDSVKGPGRTKVHAIAGPVSEPCSNRQALVPGIRYHWMTQALGGLFFNICLEDWNPVLQNLGLNVFVPLESWNLSQAADPASVTVTVDGIPVLFDPSNGFTYSASSNIISFHGSSVPSPGQQIQVNYLGNCNP
ncbi:MAG: choice-of-anchor D domain-containing protein [Deltaproteobacteria bacterium]|nr:choice-of-anchor D domain-containing protein [Deltaproteobacteria bacterium]